MSATAGDTNLKEQMGNAQPDADMMFGLMRVLETMRMLNPPTLVERRCRECNKLLCRAEQNAHLEVKCPRCRAMITFP